MHTAHGRYIYRSVTSFSFLHYWYGLSNKPFSPTFASLAFHYFRPHIVLLKKRAEILFRLIYYEKKYYFD